jgi:phosphoglycolate phosphatase
VKEFRVDRYFDEILGQVGRTARRKEEMALAWAGRNGIDPKDVLVIGDTVYDHDVARAIGCDCVLISNGHQSRAKLLTCGVTVLSHIGDIIDKLENNAND